MKNKVFVFVSVLLLIAIASSLLFACKPIGDNGEGGGNDEKEKPSFTFGFISDIHMMDKSEIYDDTCESFLAYNYQGQRLIPMAQSIFQTVVDKYIEDKVNCVFICGDLTELGSKTSLNAVAKECKRLEEAGISVYIADGYADIRNKSVTFEKDGQVQTDNATMEDFAEIFKDFGYDEAIFRNPNNLSYACDIPGSEFRLINISTDFYDKDDLNKEANTDENPTITDADIAWMENILMDAQKYNKQVVVMSYYPISDQLGKSIGNIFNTYSIKMQNSEKAANLFTKYGVKYVVSGHLHLLNETTYTGENGGAFQGLSTGCLCNYPMCYNYISYYASDNSYERTTKFLTAIDEKYIPGYIDDDLKAQVTTNLHTYVQKYLYESIHDKMHYLLDEQYGHGENSLFIEYLYRLSFFDDHYNPPQTVIDLAAGIGDIFWRFFDMPIYMRDETPEHNESVERYMSAYGYTLPESDYISFSDLMIKIFCKIYRNDSHLTGVSTDSTLLTYCAYTLFAMVADFDIFAKAQVFLPELEDFDLHPVFDKVISEGIFDMRKDDALLHILEIVAIALNSRLGNIFHFTDTDALLNLVATLLPVAMPVLFPEDYNPQDQTIAGISYTRYLDLEAGTINIKLLIEEVFFDIFLKELLH